MKIIGSRIPFEPSVRNFSVGVEGIAYSSQLSSVGESLPISLDQAYVLWKSPDFAGCTQGHKFIDFVDHTLKPRGYRIV